MQAQRQSHQRLRKEGNQAGENEVFSIFWLNPIFIAAGFIFPLILVSFALPATIYSEIWNTPKYLGYKELILCVAAIGCLILGAIMSTVTPTKRVANAVLEIESGLYTAELYKCYKIAAALCLTAYAIWFGLMISGGIHISYFIDMLKGEQGGMGEVREHTDYVAGVTTPMQLGVCVGILYVILRKRIRGKLFHLSACMVFLLTVFRGFFRTERLALLEMAVPALLVLLRLRWKQIPRSWLYIFPVIAITVPYGLFLVTERFRWWANVQSVQSMNYFQFCLYHLLGYYTTALNNGSAMWDMNMTSGAPTAVFNWFYYFPIIKPYIMAHYPGISLSTDDYSLFLTNYLNESFTNESGIFPVYVDLGLFWGLAFWFLAGFVAMSLYRGFARGELVGLFLFPLFVIGLTELPRILYWTSTRAFCIWCFLLIIIYVVMRARRKHLCRLQGTWLHERVRLLAGGNTSIIAAE